MKKQKTNKQSLKGNTKISDFFTSKTSPKAATSSDFPKRKFNDLTKDPNEVIVDITNSPNSKKHKFNGASTSSETSPAPTGQNSIQIPRPKQENKKAALFTTPIKERKSAAVSVEKTTQSSPRKTTPKKALFDKCPQRLEEFKVEVIEKFVTVTPSKKSSTTPKKFVQCKVGVTPEISPTKSETSLIEESGDFSEIISPLKSRTKLQFDNSRNETQINGNDDLSDSQFNLSDLESAFDHDDYFTLPNETPEDLSFEQSQHCIIIDIQAVSHGILLKLQSTKNNKYGTCILKQFWATNNFIKGATVYIQASNKIDNQWVIDNESGWLIYEPDLLISGTTVVGSLFCKRRSVLQERYQGFDPGNKQMLIGNLVHLLLQTTLKNNLKSIDAINIKLKEIISSKKIIKNLYEIGVTIQELETELNLFIPRILDFMLQYVTGKSQAGYKSDNWKGRITSIDDIEENLWCPELGLKGKIDVTINANSKIMPLELKTGRATVSLEHRGQVILYIMMMNKLGYKVSSGLLLYLREGVLKEINITPQEQRDIVILRNELAYYISRNSIQNQNSKSDKKLHLPDPINHHSACGKCPYNVICASFLKADNYDLTRNKGLKEIESCISAYLTDEHLNYFMHWSDLIVLETNHKTNEKSLRDIYTVEPEQREKRGKCIINMKVTSVVEEPNGLFSHIFKKDDLCGAASFFYSGISENEYIVVSTDKRPAVATGFVTEIEHASIKLTLDRNLNKKFLNKTFHLDTYDSSASQTFNFSSLAILLENTPRALDLRRIIIEKKSPKFSQKLPAIVAKRGAPILKKMNPAQQKAVLRAISAQEYFLIKGMPGTGKTATIVALIRLLVAINKSVILTSHTHSAVDNVCGRLLEHEVDFIRLGSDGRISDKVKANSEHNLTKNCTTPEQLEEVYNKFSVVAVTCLGSGHPLLSKRVFDYCIIDESSQVLQTSVIRPIYAAKSFILIGDPDQLAPVVKNRDAIDGGMTESLFERLNTPEATINLTLNYRMNKTITHLANILTYEGQLQPANNKIADNTLNLPKFENLNKEYEDQKWVLDVLNCSLEKSVQFIDTGPVWQLSQTTEKSQENEFESQNCINKLEAEIVRILIHALIKGGVSCDDIGVIATYRAQVAQLSTILNVYNIETNTVDQFQGRDKNVIIYSCTKSKEIRPSSNDSKYELLEDKRRLTVAITRAKQKLILIGDKTTLCRYTTFSKIFEALDEKNFVSVDVANLLL